jgi:hypothetical protein
MDPRGRVRLRGVLAGREGTMSDKAEWYRVYGRPTLFVGGVAVGDCYRSSGADAEIWRVRLWRQNRLQGGDEKLVLASAGEETARRVLQEMFEAAPRGEAG